MFVKAGVMLEKKKFEQAVKQKMVFAWDFGYTCPLLLSNPYEDPFAESHDIQTIQTSWPQTERCFQGYSARPDRPVRSGHVGEESQLHLPFLELLIIFLLSSSSPIRRHASTTTSNGLRRLEGSME